MPQYEILGRKMLNDARIIEVATEAELGKLRQIAVAIIDQEKPKRPYMVRVFFYFRGEEPGSVLPRYRVEWTARETRVVDFTKERKVAGLRY